MHTNLQHKRFVVHIGDHNTPLPHPGGPEFTLIQLHHAKHREREREREREIEREGEREIERGREREGEAQTK